MKPIFRRGLGVLLIAACAAVWIVTSGMSVRERRTRTCQGKARLEVIVTDSLERQFVGKEDVAAWLDREYRAYAGLPLDSVDLRRIEQLVLSHSAVRETQAWLTDDGVLHITLSQRQPVLRFETGDYGYYTDATGFVFPLQARGSADVCVVDGYIPLRIPKGFKGEPEAPAQKQWLSQMIALTAAMQGTSWEKNIERISVNAAQDLVLTPCSGQERFLFGPPVRIDNKLYLLQAYYQAVAPLDLDYRTVDLRFRDQLVCRK